MSCTSCGAEFLEGAAFCGECGTGVGSGDVLRVTLDDADSSSSDATSTLTVGAAAVGAPTADPSGPPPAAPAAPVAAVGAPPLLSDPPALPYLQQTPRESPTTMFWATVGAVGAVIVVIGTFLAWFPDVPIKENAFNVSFSALTSNDTFYTPDSNGIGILFLVLAIVGAATSFVPKAGLIRTFCGVGVLVVVILYLVQVNARVQEVNDFSSGVSLGDFLAPGFYVTAVGGFLMAAAPPRWR